MAKTIRVNEGTYQQLLAAKATLEADRGKVCSFDEVIAFLAVAAGEATFEGLVRTS